MRRLVLVRHGQSEWNVERRIQGQAGTGLSPTGVEQAQHVARWIARRHPDVTLVSSDLQRCQETVAPIAEALGTDVRFDAAFRERDFGSWSGKLLTEIETSDPERWHRWRGGADVVAEVGGESSPQLAARVLAGLEELVDRTPAGGTTVLVTHGGPVWHGTHAFLGLAEGTLGGVANTAVTELVVDDTWGRRLDVWNQTSHLPADLVTTLRPADASSDGRSAPPVGR